MIYGIGCDLVDVTRIKEVFADQSRWSRVFTSLEIAYFEKFSDPWPVIAGHFASKEAITKALGTGFSKGIGFHDVEISHHLSGAPFAILSDKVKKQIPEIKTVLISISHEKNMAMAYAIAY